MTGTQSVIRQDGPDVLVSVHVQPRASRNYLAPAPQGTERGTSNRVLIRLTAPPAGGAANAACRAFLAQLLGLPKSRVVIVRGETARHKLLRIRNADAAAVMARLQAR